jgi:WD repeat-containing protein 70
VNCGGEAQIELRNHYVVNRALTRLKPQISMEPQDDLKIRHFTIPKSDKNMDEEDIPTEELEIAEGDPMRNFLPTSFGKQTRAANVDEQIRRTKRTDITEKSLKRLEEGAVGQSDASAAWRQGPVGETPNSHGSEKDDDADDDDEDDEDEYENKEVFPVTHELILKTHERAVTTASLDPSGSRLVTGSRDCTLKFHDFASMTPSTLRAFKSIDPTATKASANQGTHPVNHVEFNPLSAGQILVVPATSQAKIVSRDGKVLTEFVKGDMYLQDMKNTKGHISEIVTGTWNPTDRNICVTAGTDSTLRIWDVNNKRSQKEVIVYLSKNSEAGRSRMTAVAWGNPTQGGTNVLIGAALDGGLAMWKGDGPFRRPAAKIEDAHTKGTWIGGVDISADGNSVVTRGGDNLIKCMYIFYSYLFSLGGAPVLINCLVWDTRKFNKAVRSVSHPSTSAQYPTSNIRFSPNSEYIITGSETGHLHIFSPVLTPVITTPVTLGSPLITVLWHDKLNQIITGSANAETHILYNDAVSSRGALYVVSKAPKQRHIDDDPSLTTDLSQGLSGDGIVNPNGLFTGANQASISYAARHPTVGLTASGKSRDPRRPERPMVTPFAKSQPDERHIKEHIPLSSMRDEDPREALLKYAEVAEKDPMFTNAWKLTQPKT